MSTNTSQPVCRLLGGSGRASLVEVPAVKLPALLAPIRRRSVDVVVHRAAQPLAAWTQMDKDEWKQFLRWLDDANEGELAQMKQRLRSTQAAVTEPGVRSDLRRMLRLIDEDVLIRQNLATRSQGHRWPHGLAASGGTGT
jgi:hypothetical protein